jgi:hypothetical protein
MTKEVAVGCLLMQPVAVFLSTLLSMPTHWEVAQGAMGVYWVWPEEGVEGEEEAM